MTEDAPLVSVLMPAFNAMAFLERAVQSVQGQTLGEWELFIVDDGSSDDTVKLARSLAADDPRIHVLETPENQGAAAARNLGLQASRGRYIAFLDADDEWLPEKLKTQIEHLQTTGASFAFSSFWRATSVRRHQVLVPKDVTHAQLLKANVIGCLTAIYDSAALGRVEMPDYRLSHDYALWLALLARTDRAVGVVQPLAIHHRSAGSLSANIWRSAMGTWQVFRRHQNLSRRQSAAFLASHLIKRFFALHVSRPR